jgi:mRNA-degrading endonuclease RelE of RelBE toxin-antitoxin system
MSPDYTLRLTREADKDLTRLRKMRGRAGSALRKLQGDPLAGHALSGTLAGAHSLAFSMPGGAYRAAYVVLEEERTCLVFLVGPHENFYKKAARRYKALQKQGML